MEAQSKAVPQRAPGLLTRALSVMAGTMPAEQAESAGAVMRLVRRVVNASTSAWPLGLCRVLLCAIMLVEVFQILYFRRLIFDEVPFAQASRFQTLPLLGIWMIALASLMVGFKTRLAAIINYLLAMFVMGYSVPNSGFSYHADSVYIGMSLLFIFLPSGRALSVDALIERARIAARPGGGVYSQRVSAFYVGCLSLIVGLIYFDSVFWKGTSPMWLAGLGFWTPATLPQSTYFDISWLLRWEWLVKLMGYFVLVFETVFVFLVWSSRLRPLLALLGMCFHIGIAVLFPLPLFGLAMLPLFLGMLPVSWYEWMGARMRVSSPRMTVLFDELCPLCRATRAVIEALDVRRAVRFVAVQRMEHEAPSAAQAVGGLGQDELLRSMYSVDARGRVREGVASYAAMFRAMGWAAPAGWLLSAWPVSAVARRVYAEVAANRARGPECRDGVCTPAWAARTEPARDEDAPYRPRPFWVAVACGFLAVWFVSFVAITFSSPFYVTYIAPGSEWARAAQRWATNYWQTTFPITGWTSHGIFMHTHFENYTAQTAMVYRHNGEETFLPIVDERGHARPFAWGRGNVKWLFDTVPSNFTSERMGTQLLRFAAFWAGKNRIDLTQGQVVVLRRTLHAPVREWDPDCFVENQETPWHDAAIISGPRGRLTIRWLEDVNTGAGQGAGAPAAPAGAGSPS